MGLLDLCKKEEYTLKEIVCSYSVLVFSFPPVDFVINSSLFEV